MHLQLPFRSHQMQGLLWLERWQRMQTRTVQNPMIGTALLAGSMAWAQAGGHLGRFHVTGIESIQRNLNLAAKAQITIPLTPSLVSLRQLAGSTCRLVFP